MYLKQNQDQPQLMLELPLIINVSQGTEQTQMNQETNQIRRQITRIQHKTGIQLENQKTEKENKI